MIKTLYNKIVKIFNGGWKCPQCGGHNTSSTTYADWCNDCSYSQGY